MKVNMITRKTKLYRLIVSVHFKYYTMNLFLYIQITDAQEDVKFYSPIISKIKQNNIDLIFYDIDNHSEPFIIGYADKLLSGADKKAILFDTELNSNFSKLMPLLTNLLDNPEGIEIFIKGTNQRLEKMMSIFAHLNFPETTHENEIIEQIVNRFS